MRVHHLNCGTMRPFGGRLVNGDRLPVRTARLVCHCLLIETDRALILIDTGFGLGDVGAPRPARVRFLTRARLDADETAARQLARLGHAAGDVTDVVLTHLDADHAGGLPDFPGARVHLTRVEHSAAMSPSTPIERTRYRTRHWAHGPDWVVYDVGAGGNTWFGFAGIRELDGLPDLALIPLPGHSRGHAGVALHLGDRWLLHAGDAYFDHREVDPVAPRSTPGLARFQARYDVDGAARRANQARLREVRADHGGEVAMFCSHDPLEYDRLREEAPR
jgi:glyoxylase-like metal-dependent hydrolase (beta-lactamase superfamily II)